MTNHENGPPAAPRLVVSQCGAGTCPTVYDTDRDTVLVQGHPVADITAAEGELLVEIPRALLLEAARRIQAEGIPAADA